jgi:Carboxypeptidase regulatory-like domain
VALVPAVAHGQASIHGTARDTTGSVMPGVTVEASSPALIERARSVVTDGSGQYRIVDLRPGVYAVTFTLQGFSTIRREGIELVGDFTASVNADLRVGALEETVTVTGGSPIVDLQRTTQQRAFTQEIIEAPRSMPPTTTARRRSTWR